MRTPLPNTSRKSLQTLSSNPAPSSPVTGSLSPTSLESNWETSRLEFSDKGTNLRVGEDWTPLGISTNAQVEKAEAVFVGYGLTVSELKHDDYAGAMRPDALHVAGYA